MQERTIEFLYLDRESCGRCRATEARLMSAVEQARPALEDLGVRATVRSIHVTSAEQAEAVGLRSSPTIRVEGRDIAARLVESACESACCATPSGGAIDCRLWEWNGELHVAPPPELIVEAIVAAHGPRPRDEASAGLPDNLRRFFDSSAAGITACCSEDERRSCCDAKERDACCGGGAEGTCGCR